jgi:hypothetical protein
MPISVMLPLLVLGYCSTWIVYVRHFHPLAKYPGPLSASITRFWLIIDVARGSSEKTQRRLHEQYGKVIWSIHSGAVRADKA